MHAHCTHPSQAWPPCPRHARAPIKCSPSPEIGMGAGTVIHRMSVVQTPSGDWDRLHWDWFTELRGGLYQNISISKRNFSWIRVNPKMRVALSLRVASHLDLLPLLVCQVALGALDPPGDSWDRWLEPMDWRKCDGRMQSRITGGEPFLYLTSHNIIS
jgi:hypothetical protein